MRGDRGGDRMVVGFPTTCAYHHSSCEFEPCSWRGVLDTTLCDQVCQWLVAGQWFFPGTPVSSTNKTDHHGISELLLKPYRNVCLPTATNLLMIIHKKKFPHRVSFVYI